MKRKAWVWVVPSVLFHVVLLTVWMRMPEPPPRAPGTREVTIQPEQAEQLQRHVEDANLRLLQAKVAELQAIRAAMGGIRERRMAALREFEGEMVREAPRDILELLAGLVETQQSVRSIQEDLLEAVLKLNERTPAVEAVLKEDPAAGLLILDEIHAMRQRFGPVIETLEDEFTQTAATLQTMGLRMEWIREEGVMADFEALGVAVGRLELALEQVNREIGSSVGGRNLRALNELVENRDAYVETLRQIASRDGDASVDRNLQRKEREIHGRLSRAFERNADPQIFRQFLDQQTAFFEQAERFRDALEAM